MKTKTVKQWVAWINPMWDGENEDVSELLAINLKETAKTFEIADDEESDPTGKVFRSAYRACGYRSWFPKGGGLPFRETQMAAVNALVQNEERELESARRKVSKCEARVALARDLARRVKEDLELQA